MRKKILVYGQTPPPYHGCNIMTEFFLDASKEAGYKTKISEKSFSNKIAEVNKINIKKFLKCFPNFFRYIFNLITFSPDLVMFFISGTRIGLLGESIFLLITKLMGNQYILYLEVSGYKNLYNKIKFFHKYLPWLFNGAEGIIVLGEMLKKEIESFCNSNIYIIPNCIRNKEREYFEKKNKSDIINILYLSNITKSKGAWTLLEAIPEIVKDMKNAKFTIAGPWQDKKFENEVMKYTSEYNLEKFIDFLGPVYGEEKDLLFRESDIFVFPTDYPLEAMPLVILEAMRASLPVISTNIGAVPEMIINDEIGFIINPNDTNALAKKIVYLTNNSVIREKMGKRGRQRFEKYYSFDAYKNRIKEVLEKVL